MLKEFVQPVITVSTRSRNNTGHYLPHREVIKEESAATKIRPVFDAKEKGKPALNDCLERIPTLLLRFRKKKFRVTSDIKNASYK